ncbi:MAG: 30S ribosomal protein S12 methylthiotransferase RimO [Bacteroidales bacterium]|nr:30S ribosomal protein S12 methylthiotransferase RimO [Bacteroidales bacterium]
MPRKTVKVVSLGCSKNLVDSERLMKMLSDAGLILKQEDEPAHVVVINTCGFIGDAKEESIEEILNYTEQKADGEVEKVFVMGCLSQRYAKELPEELPEVDGWYGKFDWPALVGRLTHSNPAVTPYDRVLTTGPHHAYIKISEGCNRFCAFCAIPLITGRHRSRPIDEILEEVQSLVGKGIKEFNVIAQDLSSYGLDLYKRQALPELVDRMAQISGVEWIRLHYAYPAQFPMDLLDVMARHKNVCRYLDIALQHISDPVLSNMRRHITGKETRQLLKEIRRLVPGIHIRTTLMVGFPGEGEEEFQELLQFVEEQRFERMGAFAYCEEEDTWGAKNLTDDIPQDVKEQRLSQLMELQERIALELQEEKIGQRLRVIIDREEEEFYVGRTEFDSPEVDPEVLIRKGRQLKRGEFYTVAVEEALPFELIASVVDDADNR